MLIFKKTPEQQLQSDIRRLKKEIRAERAVVRIYKDQLFTLENELRAATAMEVVNADTTKRDFLTGKESKIQYTPEEKAEIKRKNKEMQADRLAHINDLKETETNIHGHITSSFNTIRSKTKELRNKEASLEKLTEHKPKAGEVKKHKIIKR